MKSIALLPGLHFPRRNSAHKLCQNTVREQDHKRQRGEAELGGGFFSCQTTSRGEFCNQAEVCGVREVLRPVNACGGLVEAGEAVKPGLASGLVGVSGAAPGSSPAGATGCYSDGVAPVLMAPVMQLVAAGVLALAVELTHQVRSLAEEQY